VIPILLSGLRSSSPFTSSFFTLQKTNKRFRSRSSTIPPRLYADQGKATDIGAPIAAYLNGEIVTGSTTFDIQKLFEPHPNYPEQKNGFFINNFNVQHKNFKKFPTTVTGKDVFFPYNNLSDEKIAVQKRKGPVTILAKFYPTGQKGEAILKLVFDSKAWTAGGPKKVIEELNRRKNEALKEFKSKP